VADRTAHARERSGPLAQSSACRRRVSSRSHGCSNRAVSRRRTIWHALSVTAMTLVIACQPSPDAAVTAQGDVQPAWVVTYDGPKHKNDMPADIVLSPDGATAFVAGTNHSNRCVDFSTIAYDTTDGSKRLGATARSCGRIAMVTKRSRTDTQRGSWRAGMATLFSSAQSRPTKRGMTS
jgi:hypothetical protein